MVKNTSKMVKWTCEMVKMTCKCSKMAIRWYILVYMSFKMVKCLLNGQLLCETIKNDFDVCNGENDVQHGKNKVKKLFKII